MSITEAQPRRALRHAEIPWDSEVDDPREDAWVDLAVRTRAAVRRVSGNQVWQGTQTGVSARAREAWARVVRYYIRKEDAE